MHETRSSHFKGYIDKVLRVNGIIEITGWVISLKKDSPSNYCVLDSPLKISQTSLPRKDVSEFYKSTDLKFELSGFVLKIKDTQENIVLNIDNEEVFRIKPPSINTSSSDFNSILLPNSSLRPELVVVDNFYKDVDKVREFALRQKFQAQIKYHKGYRTIESFTPSWIKSTFEKCLGLSIKEFTGATGIFQYCTAEDAVVYHTDAQEYAAMIYLSPDAPLGTGTCTYKSKITGLFKKASEEDARRLNKTRDQLDRDSFNGYNFYDKHNLELVDSVANVYNRLVIFNSHNLHSAASYYGSTKENSRLFHLFFFNVN